MIIASGTNKPWVEPTEKYLNMFLILMFMVMINRRKEFELMQKLGNWVYCLWQTKNREKKHFSLTPHSSHQHDNTIKFKSTDFL